MLADWTDVKNLLTGRSLSAQYTVIGTNYWIKAIDGAFQLECIIPIDTSNSDSLDFVTNFKTGGNKLQIQNTSVETQPPYGSKTISVNSVTKKLFARNVGVQFAVATGSNTLTYTVALTWAKLLGVEAIGCEALDTVDFKVFDTPAGTYSGVPNLMLNQFAFSLNLPKDYYQRYSQFDADVYAGMILQMTYTSQSTKTVGFNLLMDEVR